MEKILVSTTWGLTDPTRAGLAFAYAMTATKQGDDVIIFLFHDATPLAQKGVYSVIVPIGPPPLEEVMDALIEKKVRIYVCKACYLNRGLQEKDLVSTAQLKGITDFAELARERKVVTF